MSTSDLEALQQVLGQFAGAVDQGADADQDAIDEQRARRVLSEQVTDQPLEGSRDHLQIVLAMTRGSADTRSFSSDIPVVYEDALL